MGILHISEVRKANPKTRKLSIRCTLARGIRGYLAILASNP